MSQVIVTNPLEVVKIKLQTSEMTVKEILSQIKGFGDLYRGAEACVARDVLFSAILFPLYSHLKPFLLTLLSTDGSMAFISNIIAGSMAAAPAAFLATPMDLVKTRMQQSRQRNDMSSSETSNFSSVVTYKNNNKVPLALGTAFYRESKEPTFMETTKGIIENEGFDVLFSGSLERVARSIPQFGVTLAVFDYLSNLAVSFGLLP
jgi:solute carrier family 25 aspartate/glutamate transporter 12/13